MARARSTGLRTRIHQGAWWVDPGFPPDEMIDSWRSHSVMATSRSSAGVRGVVFGMTRLSEDPRLEPILYLNNGAKLNATLTSFSLAVTGTPSSRNVRRRLLPN